MSEKERISLAIEPDLLERFDAYLAGFGGNRSEVVRDLIRNRLMEQAWVGSAGERAVGTVTLIYDHTKRELADRLLELGHDNHDAIMATLHVHLDHNNCLEVIALQGAPPRLNTIAARLMALKGVKHGKLVVGSAEP